MYHNNQRQGQLFTLSAILTGATLMAGVGIYMVLKSVETPVVSLDKSLLEDSVVAPDLVEAPVDISVLPPKDIPAVPRIQKPQTHPGKNLGGVNWEGRDLQGMTLRNANLGGANLEDTDLSGADLSGAILSGANLANAEMSGVNLSGANLSGANLDNANLTNANLSSADLRGANLDDANLEGATLKGTLLDGANLSGATMP